jgi:hypothetical protein
MRMLITTAFALFAAAQPALARQESDEALKERILEKVRLKIQQEGKAILERMAKIIDEELAGGAAPKAPKEGDKRIRELERKLRALDDQRDDLLRDIRGVKREIEDAKIIEEAKKAAPETMQEAQDEFKSYFDAHDEATKSLEDHRDKAVKGFEKSIAGFKRLYYAFKDQPESNGHRGIGLPSAYNVACGYALLGKKTEAIDWLEIAIAAGWQRWDHMREDTDLDGLRKERRFLRLLADR